jgi:chromosome partitioning protein
MRNTITVMNAKGGVGKSTLVLALAETLSNDHGRKVLVIDSDAQASISHMLLPQDSLETTQNAGRTIVDYLIGAVLKQSTAKWQDFIVTGASDVDDARSIHLLPSDTQLTLFEREVSKGEHERELRKVVGALLKEARLSYDLVLIDSAPGLSVLTECWLREADFYVSPTRPDYISSRGLKFLRQFRERDPQMGFAEPLGVIINMKDPHAPEDAQYEQWLRQDAELKCFRQAILRVTPLQSATRFAPALRSYWAKYPGQTGASLRELTSEVIWRLAASQPGATHQPQRGRSALYMGPSF